MWCFPLNLKKGDTHRERLVPEVPQAPCQLLGGAIVLTINKSAFSRHLKHPHLMIKVFGAIIGHGHYVGIVVLVVIVEAVEEEAKPNPAVNGPVYMPSGWALGALEKKSKCQAFQAHNIYTFAAVYQKANPSAPILPLPVTLKVRSTSHLRVKG